jgi:hypothetical protein
LKLVVSRGGSGSPELYDLSKDIGEKNNLAASQPEKVKQLQAKWDAWSAEQVPPSAPDQTKQGKKDKKDKRAKRQARKAA